jgi:hypothetical protein
MVSKLLGRITYRIAVQIGALASRLIADFHSITRVAQSYFPIIDDGPPTFRPKPTRASIGVRTRALDHYLSDADANASAERLFGEPNVLQRLARAIRICSNGRPYTGAACLSNVVRTFSPALRRFLVECPPGSAEWLDLLNMMKTSQIFCSTSAQSVWLILPSLREVATAWSHRQDQIAIELARIKRDADSEEAAEGHSAPPAPRPNSRRAKKTEIQSKTI